MDIQGLGRAFSYLQRPQETPSGLVGNHWQFAVRHVPLNPPGDLLHLVNPGSRYEHSEGPAQVLSRPSAVAQAEAVLPLLFKSFVTGLGANEPVLVFAP